MKRIGLSMRVYEVSSYKETRDCIDQAWFRLFEHFNFFPVLIPNSLKDPSAFLREANLDGIILSGGNDLTKLPNASNTSLDRDFTEKQILMFAIENNVKLLGVCRGMQFINDFFGGGFIRVEGHVAKRHPIYSKKEHFIFQMDAEVNTFHNFAIDPKALGKDLVVVHQSKDETIESIAHISLPIYGIMWHPEREGKIQSIDNHIFKNIFYG